MLLAERIERPASLFGAVEPERPTLDDAIVGAWEGLAAHVVVACPLCGGALRPHADPDALGGRCGDCGTTLD